MRQRGLRAGQSEMGRVDDVPLVDEFETASDVGEIYADVGEIDLPARDWARVMLARG